MLYMMLPNGELISFVNATREALIKSIKTQESVRDFSDYKAVEDVQESMQVLLPTYMFAEYLSICYELGGVDESPSNRSVV